MHIFNISFLQKESYLKEDCKRFQRRLGVLRHIKAWEIQFLSQKYGVTKLLLSE